MRTLNTLKSAATGVAGQIVTILLQFVSRTVFIHTVGVAYLGISGLFASVLTVLSVTDLGLGVAVVYSLYKPLADGDEKRVAAIMNYLRAAYRVIGVAVLALGILLYPFLPYLLKGSTDLVNITLVYSLYVLHSVSTYWFFAYKSALLQADQKRYVINVVTCLVAVFTAVLQIIALVVFRSYIGYLLATFAGTVIKNGIAAAVTDRQYPYLKTYRHERLSKAEKREMLRYIYGMSMFKFSTTILESTDNLIISAAISNLSVAIYLSYNLIMNAIIQLNKNIFSAFTASIGNLNVTEGRDRRDFVFRCTSFLNFWVYGFCSVALFNMFNPFVTLWVGGDMLFSQTTVLVIVLNFMTTGLHSAVISFRDACGLFRKGKYRPVATAVINIIVSLLLVKPLGVTGVFLGTVISNALTTWWYDPWLVCREALGVSPFGYYARYFRNIALISAVGGFIYVVTLPLAVHGAFILLLVRAVLCTIIPNLVFFAIFGRSEEFRYIVSTAKPYYQKAIKKLKGVK